MTRFMLCIAALLCALAAPAGALAQGAGDEQYQDPFGDEESQAEPTPSATPAPAQSAPSAPAPTATPSAAQAPAPAPAPVAAAPSQQLPRTGVDAGWIALAGAVLLAAGLALRRADHQR